MTVQTTVKWICGLCCLQEPPWARPELVHVEKVLDFAICLDVNRTAVECIDGVGHSE